MSMGSLEFLAVFLPVLWLLYWVVPRRAAVQNAVLLLASWLFYATWSPKLLGVLVATTVVNYLAIHAMARYRSGSPWKLRLVFWLAVSYDALQLLGFKYTGFFAESLNLLMGTELPSLRFVLPLGISFWTLQLVGYLVDVYYDRAKPEPSKVAFAVFVAFFPQIVSGPIPRGGELLPQFAEARRPSAERFRSACGVFFLGYVLKFFVADSLAQFVVNPVFADHASYSGIGHWLGLAGYCGQVFGDFAGYSIMAIGCGRLFGIEVPLNFDYPFFSKDMMELWRRWHITLNRWLFDYLYWPLVGSKGFFRKRLDTGFILVFAFSGLWHGATWAFVAWGVLHGIGLSVQRRWDEGYRKLCKRDRKWVKRRRTFGYSAFAWGVTQLFFLLTLVPFRAPDMGVAWDYFGGLFALSGRHHPLGGNPLGALAVLGGVLFLLAYHLLELARLQRLRARFFALPAPVRGVCYGLFLVLLLMLMPVGAGAFIYAQF